MLKIPFLSLLFLVAPVQAEMILDGSLGPQVTLPGPHYQISAELGQQQGGNLFHSFLEFNISPRQRKKNLRSFQG